MAKALLGYVGGPDLRLVDEVTRLRHLVAELERQIVRLEAERDSLAATCAAHRARDEDVLALALADVREQVGLLR